MCRCHHLTVISIRWQDWNLMMLATHFNCLCSCSCYYQTLCIVLVFVVYTTWNMNGIMTSEWHQPGISRYGPSSHFCSGCFPRSFSVIHFLPLQLHSNFFPRFIFREDFICILKSGWQQLDSRIPPLDKWVYYTQGRLFLTLKSWDWRFPVQGLGVGSEWSLGKKEEHV